MACGPEAVVRLDPWKQLIGRSTRLQIPLRPHESAPVRDLPSREVRTILSIMIRALGIACLSLLLLGMQQQLVVHELEHLRAKLERSHDVVAENPGGASCVQCALLAVGSGVGSTHQDNSAVALQATAPIAVPSQHARAQPSPASYLSRAPPSFA